MMAYVMIEKYLQGCRVAITIVGVTFDQQYSYNWLISGEDEFISRSVEQVPVFD